jgi:uncharacterized protein (TIGR02611 family)
MVESAFTRLRQGRYRRIITPWMKKKVKKIAVGIAGGIVLLAGIAMIVLPGPAFVVIPLGLGILATEFEWARRWFRKARLYIHIKRERWKQKRAAHAS